MQGINNLLRIASGSSHLSLKSMLSFPFLKITFDNASMTTMAYLPKWLVFLPAIILKIAQKLNTNADKCIMKKIGSTRATNSKSRHIYIRMHRHQSHLRNYS